MTCAYCGKEFETRMCRQRFCSEKCRLEYYNREDREKREKNAKVKIVKCWRCGKEFVKKNGNQRYCSAECKGIVEKEQRTRYNKKRCRGIPLQINEVEQIGGWVALGNAIVKQAANDYLKALKEYERHPHNNIALGEIKSCERFFRGEWFGLLTTLDPDMLIQKLRKEVTNWASQELGDTTGII